MTVESQFKRRKTLNELFNANESNQECLQQDETLKGCSHTHYVFDARTTLLASGASGSGGRQVAAILKSRRTPSRASRFAQVRSQKLMSKSAEFGSTPATRADGGHRPSALASTGTSFFAKRHAAHLPVHLDARPTSMEARRTQGLPAVGDGDSRSQVVPKIDF
jgi:hypothetical protein